MEHSKTPKSYEGLLRFCTEQTASEDNTKPTDFQPLSDEKREFLQNVFNSLAENDPIKRMLEIVKKLNSNLQLNLDRINTPLDCLTNLEHSPEESSPHGDEFILENASLIEKLIDYCEDLDLANDFHKIGGFIILKPLLCCRIPSLKALTCELIATLSQNNPYCQRELFNEDIFSFLVQLFSVSTVYNTDEVRIKAMYALSCLSRFNKPSQDELLRLNILSVILNLVTSNILKLQIKAAFLIGSLADENVDIKNHLRSINGSCIIITALQNTNSQDLKEQLIKALIVIVHKNELDVDTSFMSKNDKDNLKILIKNEISKLNEDSSQAFKDNLEELRILLG